MSAPSEPRVAFRVGTHTFAVRLADLHDVLLRGPLTPARRGADVRDLRARLLRPIDLRRRLGLEPLEGCAALTMLVVRSGNELWSLVVDELAIMPATPRNEPIADRHRAIDNRSDVEDG